MANFHFDELAAALRASHGLVVIAADHLGITREALHRRIQHSAQLQAVLHEARERQLDRTESKLFLAIENGDPWAIQFYLKTQGKARGYVERAEIDITTAVRQGAVALGLDPDDAVQAAEAIIGSR